MALRAAPRSRQVGCCRKAARTRRTPERAPPNDDNNLTTKNLTAFSVAKKKFGSSKNTIRSLQQIANMLHKSRRRHRITRATNAPAPQNGATPIRIFFLPRAKK
jgi:hypothetical protein